MEASQEESSLRRVRGLPTAEATVREHTRAAPSLYATAVYATAPHTTRKRTHTPHLSSTFITAPLRFRAALIAALCCAAASRASSLCASTLTMPAVSAHSLCSTCALISIGRHCRAPHSLFAVLYACVQCSPPCEADAAAEGAPPRGGGEGDRGGGEENRSGDAACRGQLQRSLLTVTSTPPPPPCTARTQPHPPLSSPLCLPPRISSEQPSRRGLVVTRR